VIGTVSVAKLDQMLDVTTYVVPFAPSMRLFHTLRTVPVPLPSAASGPIAPAAATAGDATIADLERTLAEGRGRLAPETVQVIEHNLREIELAIEQCRTALAGDPASVYLNSHLADAQRRKLALLRRAAALVAERS